MRLRKARVVQFSSLCSTACTAASIGTLVNSDLGPVYMEKCCAGQKGNPPSRVNFSERLYEKKVDPFALVKSWLSNDRDSARACSDRLALTELTPLGKPNCLYGENVDPARRVTLP